MPARNPFIPYGWIKEDSCPLPGKRYPNRSTPLLLQKWANLRRMGMDDGETIVGDGGAVRFE
jgi:hypothetical protein